MAPIIPAVRKSTGSRQRRFPVPALAVGVALVCCAVCLAAYSLILFWGAPAAAAAEGRAAAAEDQLQPRHSRLAPVGTDDVDAALGRRQCPPRGAAQRPPVAFLHVPKTGGLFLARVMAGAMPAEGAGRWCRRGMDHSGAAIHPCVKRSGLPPGHAVLLRDLKANWTRTCAGFHAHQDYTFFQALGVDHSQALTVVSLRHPVERAVSHYYFALREVAAARDAGHTFHFEYSPANASDFSGLLRYAAQPRLQANYASHLLGGAMGCPWLGGGGAPPSEAEVLEGARRNLERFCVIVINEFMGESLQQLAAAAGWPEAAVFANTTHENVTPRPRIPLWVRQKVAELNHLDMQLYEYALQLFLRRQSGS